MRPNRGVLLAGAAILALATTETACAQDTGEQTYDIAETDLKYALGAVARQAGLDLVVRSDAVQGKRAAAIHGNYTPREAIELLLRGSGLRAEIKDGTIFVSTVPAATPIATRAKVSAGTETSEILVTGSRVRGAPIASPTISITQEEMRNAGQSRLADVVRDIPQNFGGGTNSGIGFGVPESKGNSLGSASTINLRGLGSDATLTLLNGHRLTYNAADQGIDISVIPLAAVDRIEVVADGASALYGSDAVGGVANIVLKSDYDGLAASARIAGSTDGGGFQQQYGVTSGQVWKTGGVIVAYEFERDNPVMGRHRDYTADRPSITLYPSVHRHDVLVSGHQELTSTLSLSVDALYNWRRTERSYATTTDPDYHVAGNFRQDRSTAYAIAPELTWDLGEAELTLSGMYGVDRSSYAADGYRLNGPPYGSAGCYCNKAQSIELSGETPLFALGGGDARIALGAGYRNNDLHAFRTVGSAQDIRASQDSYYGFAELNLPLVGPQSGSPILHSLNVSAAVRYEDYPGIDRIATPKLGVILAPSENFEFKASWGKSFKAPTLYQRYNLTAAEVDVASYYGGSGYPASAIAMAVYGGNPNLKPERAATWTATFAAHPTAIPDLTLEIGYFNVHYRDRVVQPVTYLSQALSNPVYADLVTLNPSLADQQAVLDEALLFDYSPAGYDPANVVAIISDVSQNVARQVVQGVDGSLRYQTDLGRSGKILFNAAASYLESKQKLSALQPYETLAGTLFNPPHVRARFATTWENGPITAAFSGNCTGPVKDVRSSPALHVGSMTTFDLTARYDWGPGHGTLSGLSIGLLCQNALNAQPDLIAASRLYYTPYDSTNYSAFGRVVALSLSKKW